MGFSKKKKYNYFNPFVKRWCPRTESNRGPIDYKSIALPAELQGLLFSCEVFTVKHQLNQCIKNNIGLRCLLAAHVNCDGKLPNVKDLLEWSTNWNPASHRISKSCFHPFTEYLKSAATIDK